MTTENQKEVVVKEVSDLQTDAAVLRTKIDNIKKFRQESRF